MLDRFNHQLVAHDFLNRHRRTLGMGGGGGGGGGAALKTELAGGGFELFGFILAYCRLLHRQLAGVVQVTVTPSWCPAITVVQLLKKKKKSIFRSMKTSLTT